MKITSRAKDTIKLVVIAVIAITVFVAVLVYFTSAGETYSSLRASSFSSNTDGGMALYDGIAKMGEAYGFTVERHTKPIRYIRTKGIVVMNDITVSNLFYEDGAYERQNIISMLSEGYSFVIIDQAAEPAIFADCLDEGTDFTEYTPDFSDDLSGDYKFSFWKLNTEDSGVMCFANTNLFGINTWNDKAISEDDAYAAELVGVITCLAAEGGYDALFYDDYYTGATTDYTSDILKTFVILALAEICIAVILLMLSLCRRFGAPKKVNSTVKRDENENVYALASLYRRTGSYDVAFDVNMEALLSDLAIVIGDRISPDMRLNYRAVNDAVLAAAAEQNGPLSGYKGIKTLAEVYAREKRKIRGKRDLRKKIALIDEIRRQIKNGN